MLARLAAELDADVISVQELTPVLAARLDAELRASRPHAVLVAGLGFNGSRIYSALPLEDLTAEPLPGSFALPQAAVAVSGAPPVVLSDVHTPPPTGPDATALWSDDLGALPGAADAPLRILAGYFNATLDQAELRKLIERGYTDAADAQGAGLSMTWPSDRRLPPLVAIDHVLADERIEIVAASVHDLPGSDHRALFAELELPRAPRS